MRILYYDKYLEQLFKMPRTVQKSALEFAKKLKINPASSGIHLEPISTFRDQSLRSARVSQQYRAIVQVVPDKDLYALLWIDNHDEAYQWAANKMVSWNEETLAYQVFDAPDTIPLPAPESAAPEQADGLFGAYQDKELLKIGVPPVLLPSIRAITDLDGLEQLEGHIPDSAFENLFFLTDGASISTLMTEVAEGRVSTAEGEDPYASINNQRNFLELTDEDEVFQSILEGDFQKWRLYLHPSQRKIVTFDSKGPIKISGGAGTGKTVAAMHRLKNLVGPLGKQNVVFLTFTKALRDNLQEQARQFGLPREKYTINNIDSCLWDLCKSRQIIASELRVAGLSGVPAAEVWWDEFFADHVIQYSLEFLRDEYEQVILYHDIRDQKAYFRVSRIGRGKSISRRQRAEIWQIIEQYEAFLAERGVIHRSALYNRVTHFLNENQIRPYDACIVDELQDLSNVELRFVRALCAEASNDLFLVGDPMQRIYDRKLNFTKAGIHIRGKRSRRLRINYRTTEEIRRRAVGVIQDISYDDFDGGEESKKEYLSLFRLAAPTVRVFDTAEEERAAILELIANYQAHRTWQDGDLNQIAIACRTKNALKGIKTLLHNEGLPFYDLTATSKGNRKGIHLSTFHSLKGLEYRYVILADVNKRTCPLRPYGFAQWSDEQKEAHLHAERSLMYVAMTRAVYFVDIVGVGAPSEMLGMD